jgi:hypothetical protein
MSLGFEAVYNMVRTDIVFARKAPPSSLSLPQSRLLCQLTELAAK